MKKIKIGDKVKVDGYKPLDGEVGVVIDINSAKYGSGWVMVEFESEFSYMHDGMGKGRPRHCFLMPDYNLEFVTDDEVELENEIHAIAEKLADLCMEYTKLGRESGIPVEALLLGVKLAYDGMWD